MTLPTPASLALGHVRAVPIDRRGLIDVATAAQDHAAGRLVAAALAVGFAEALDRAIPIALQISLERRLVGLDPAEIAQGGAIVGQAEQLVDNLSAAAAIDGDLIDAAYHDPGACGFGRGLADQDVRP